jgi:hypothetical protein
MAIKVKAFSSFRSDEKKEEEGVWQTIADGVDWKLRRMRSKPVLDARKRIYGPFERAQRGSDKDLPDAVELQCTVNLLSQAVVVDWRGPGMVDDKGEPIPFTPENCAEILRDPDTGKDLRSLVISLSTDAEVFAPETAPEDLQADAGNSVTS